MKLILIALFIINCLFLPPVVQAKNTTTAAVARKAQQASSASVAGIRRFSYMPFYLVRNSFPTQATLFSSPYEGMYIRAMAIYFLNMQISTQLYGLKSTPAKLNLNFLGVLDGLVGAPQPFNMKQASSFYNENKQEIDAYFAQLRQNNALAKQWDTPSQKQINAWLKLLERQTRHSNKAVYLFPATNLLQTTIPAQAASVFQTALAQAASQAKKQVITYETAQASLEDLDNKFASHPQRLTLTYRWVKDECFYSTYLLAKNLAGKIVNKTIHNHTRLYVITAYPKTGEFLKPAHGNTFTLANGSASLRWRYHTALLVVYPYKGSHITMILDSFLGGKDPVSLDQWLAHFHADTVFSATPFLRNKTVEDAIKAPTKVIGNQVQIGRRTYDPHPVQ